LCSFSLKYLVLICNFQYGSYFIWINYDFTSLNLRVLFVNSLGAISVPERANADERLGFSHVSCVPGFFASAAGVDDKFGSSGGFRRRPGCSGIGCGWSGAWRGAWRGATRLSPGLWLCSSGSASWEIDIG
jgi:hypothetical protein